MNTPAKRYGAALLFSLLALAVRWLIDPLIGYSLYFVTAFPAVAASVWLGGPGPGCFSIGICVLWAAYFFTPPRFGYFPTEAHNIIGSTAFVVSAAVIVALGKAVRRSRERIRSAERDLRELTDSLPVLICHIGTDFRYRLNNKAYQDWFGVPSGEIAGQPLSDVLGPEAFATVKPHLDAVLRGEERTFRDFFPSAKNGGRWVNVTYRPHRNGSGEIDGIIGLLVDITEQHRAEAELAEREREFRGIFELNATGAAQTDLETGQFTRVNGKFREMLGYTTEELLQRKIADLTHPEDRARDREVFRAALQSRAAQWESELRFIRRDGSVAWALLRGTILRDDSGKAVRTIASIIDLTDWKNIQNALQESEARLRFALDAGGFGAWEWLIEEDRVIWSERLYRMHGIAREQFDGTTADFQRVVHPEDLPKVRAAIEAALKGISDYQIEFRVVRPNGETVWIWTSAILFRNDGRATRMIGITAEITERKKLDELLRSQAQHLEVLVQQRTERLQEVITELEGFAYTIAHDLRAPLRSMSGFASILIEEYGARLDAEARGYLHRISASAERMDALINDVLAYSLITRQDLRFDEIDPEPLLQAIVENSPALQKPAAEVDLRGPFPPVLGSTALLTQCFSNLLANAVKFVAHGITPLVQVYSEQSDETVTIFVRDNGIGIAPEHHERVFGLFQRLNKDYAGTGIGLAIAKRAAERMHGHIGVASEPGKGSCFWVKLKLSRRQEHGL